MLQTEYYVVERENNDQYPLFSWDQPENEYGLGIPVKYVEPLKFRLGEPIPNNPELVDFHEAPEPIISFALARILEKLNIYGVQLIPAKVRNSQDPFSEVHDYCFMHVWNRISCLDRVKSIITTNKAGDIIWGIDELVLDEKSLGQYELSQRLIFELTENTSVLLVHETIKSAIESINPKGIRFIPATQWNSDSTFD